MIFLTVGSHMPFNRLVRAIDEWCDTVPGISIFAQLGYLEKSDYRPRNFEWTDVLTPRDFRSRFAAANLIASHAGMGTIIDAMSESKSLLVMPRKAPQETRNDHQFATVRFLAHRFGIAVAYDELQVAPSLKQLLTLQCNDLQPQQLSEYAQPQLIDSLRREIAIAGRSRSQRNQF